MAYYFVEEYYVASKLAQLKSVNERDPYSGDLYTESGLFRAFGEAGLTSQQHYELYGRFEGLNPNPYFNEYEYLFAKLNQLRSIGELYEDGSVYTMETLRAAITRDGMTPLEHYERYGAFETDANGNFINPSNAFDASAYYQVKLDMCRASGETVNGKTGADITLSDVVGAFEAAGLSPVTHYARYGAGEANATGVPLVQTVPMQDRVDNDPGRASITGDILSANYNIDGGMTDPTDVGGLAGTSISPVALVISSSPPIPGDRLYVNPPDNVEDTAQNPLVGPTARGADSPAGYWLVLDRDTSRALVLDGDGAIKGWLGISIGASDSPARVLTVTIPSAWPGGSIDSLPAVDRDDVPPSVTIDGSLDNNFLSEDGITAKADDGDLLIENTFDSTGAASVTLDAEGKISGWTGYKEGEEKPTESLDLGGILDASAVSGEGTLTLDTSLVTALHRVKGSSTAHNDVTLSEKVIAYTGGAGRDVVRLVGNATVDGIVVDGGDGDDELVIAVSTDWNKNQYKNFEEIAVINGGNVTGTMDLSDAKDTVKVESGGVVQGPIQGLNGDDTISVESGGTVQGNTNGGVGNDSITINGEVGGNVIGAAGNDTLTVNGGEVQGAINGGEDNDIITVNGGWVTGAITGGDGDDKITINGGIVADIDGGADNDSISITHGATTGNITGGDGADSIDVAYSVTVNGVISGGLGADVIKLNGAVRTVEIAVGETGNDAAPVGDIFDTTGCDIIENAGDGTKLQLSGGWSAGTTLSQMNSFAPLDDNSAHWITGSYDGDTHTFTAGSGEDRLLVYDADAGTGMGAQAVVLRGVSGMAAALTTDGDILLTSNSNTSGITAVAAAGDIVIKNTIHSDGSSSVTLGSDGLISDWFGEHYAATKPTEPLLAGGTLDASAVTGTGTLFLDTSEVITDHSVKGSLASHNDVILGTGAKAYIGGQDDDSITLAGQNHSLKVEDTSGNNSLTLGAGGVELELLAGTEFTGDITGGDGADSITINESTITGNIIGGTGNNTITITNSEITGDIMSFDDNTSVAYLGGRISGNIETGAGIDTLSITNVEVIGNITSGAGNDEITVIGGSAFDIAGGQGRDTISVTDGDVQAILGGAGADIITVGGTSTITDINGGANADTITVNDGTVTNINGGNGTDSIIVNDGMVTNIAGGNGADIINVNGGTVTNIDGGADNDTITVTDGEVDDITGGAGNDSIDVADIATVNGTISGGAGADAINLNDTVRTVEIALGDTGYYDPTAGVFDVTDCDVITNAAEATTFKLAGGWDASTPLAFAWAAVGDDSVFWIAGTYDSAAGEFTEGAGADRLLVYDADATAGIGAQAVVLVGAAGLIPELNNDGDVVLVNDPNGITAEVVAGDMNIGNTISTAGSSSVTLAADGTIDNWSGYKLPEDKPTDPLLAGGTLDASTVGGAGTLTLDTALLADAHKVVGSDSTDITNIVNLGTGATAYTGGQGDDSITLAGLVHSLAVADTAGINTLNLGAGGVELTLTAATDFDGTIIGGDDDDTIIVASGAKVAGTIGGGDGDDSIRLLGKDYSLIVDDAVGANTLTLEANGAKLDLLAGTDFAGDVIGSTGRDTISINGKVDSIDGGNNHDSITVGATGDVGSIDGGINNDTISVGAGGVVDSIDGGAGYDSITIFGTVDSIDGGANNDTISIEVGGTAIDVLGGDGHDIITILGTVTGKVDGGANNDNITIDAGGFVAQDVLGDAGADTITISGTVDGLVDGGVGNDYINIDAGGVVALDVLGDAGNDTITILGTVSGLVNGGANNDYINIDAGGVVTQDVLGDAGADDITILGTVSGLVDGGAGNDTITILNAVGGLVDGGAGNDLLNLGISTAWSATDYANFERITITGSGEITNDMVLTDARETLIVEGGGAVLGSIDGMGGNDIITISGDVGVDVIGGAGNDDISVTDTGTVGGDIIGGVGNDSIFVTDGTVSGNIDGGAGNDFIEVNGGTVGGNIDGGNNNNTIIVSNSGTVAGDIIGGIHVDAITVDDSDVGNIDAGAGNDVIGIYNSSVVGNIDGGAGDDSIFIYDSNVGNIDGGAGVDTIIVTDSAVGNIIGGAGADDITLSGVSSAILSFASGDSSLSACDTITGLALDGSHKLALAAGGGVGAALSGSISAIDVLIAAIDMVSGGGLYTFGLVDGADSYVIQSDGNGTVDGNDLVIMLVGTDLTTAANLADILA